MESIFKNPFEDNNANQLSAEKVVNYWCDPFDIVINEIDEHHFLTSSLPIVLQGSRGTGKTMILKYYSFEAQKTRSSLSSNMTLMDVIQKEKQVGFYYRCEDSLIYTFRAVFSKEIVEMIIELISRNDISIDEQTFVKHIYDEVGFEFNNYSTDLEGLRNYIKNRIKIVDDFKNSFLFTNNSFQDSGLFTSFQLSGYIIQTLKNSVDAFDDVLFTITFDEFEALSIELQKRVNTLVKFVKPGISIRIGRRSEDLISFETINENEYLREGHDYRLLKLENIVETKKIKRHLISIANKRLHNVSGKLGNSDLTRILGDQESLDTECKTICGKKKKHLHTILMTVPELKDKNKRTTIINNIKNDNNPIAETINALWVIRHKSDYVAYSKQVASVMRAYFAGEDNVLTRKYKLDYQSKYRYAITCFICFVYKKKKMYYGVNAIAYISNGNVRTFMNICAEIMESAFFSERNSFIENTEISKETQSDAIHRHSQKQFEDICSIIKYGKQIRTLIQNLGNCFSEYHKDPRIRYPETNQFSFSDNGIAQEDMEIIKVAQSWALIIRKERQQRKSASLNNKGDLYTINRIFTPIFNISYRTRGGINPFFTDEEVHRLINDANYVPSVLRPTIRKDANQISFFD